MGRMWQHAGRGFVGLALVGAVVGSGMVELVGLTGPAGASNPVPSGEVAWGTGSDGTLGNGTTTASQTTPVAVSLPAGVTATAVAGGEQDGYAIGSDGNVYAWGTGTYGQLGNGTTTGTQTTPVTVSLPAGVTAKAIAAGNVVAYAIGSDGNVYAWGSGVNGALGNGSYNDQLTPTTVSLPVGVTATAIAAGDGTGYAVGSDGNLYAWGGGSPGDLGNGTTGGSSTPVTVSLPAGVTPKAIAAGGNTGYAIGSDGKLYAWGYGSDGELGNGTTAAAQTTPVAVSLPAGVTPEAIAAGYFTGYAIGSDGNIYGWGMNNDGQLGNGATAAAQTTPVTATLPAGVTPKAITADGPDAYAIGSDGHLYAWGFGASGELGNGTTTVTQSTPVTVSLPTGVVPTGLGAEPDAAIGYALVSADDLSLGQPANVTVNATGPSGAAVTYAPPTVSDPYLTTLPTPSCAPVPGSTFAIGTTTVNCTVSDVYGSSATTSFSVTVLGAGAQLGNLRQSVSGVGPGQVLSGTVNLASSLLAAGQIKASCLALTVFVVEVKVLAVFKDVTSGTANSLIASANRIQAVEGC